MANGTDVAINGAQVTLVKGDLVAILALAAVTTSAMIKSFEGMQFAEGIGAARKVETFRERGEPA